jgi:hypothetical protein
MAKGGSPHTEKFKRLAEKLKGRGIPAESAFPIAMSSLGYEGSIKAGHRRKPGYEVGGYTGDNGEEIVADEVNDVKTFEDHKGEYYVNAPMVGVLGGPDAVENLIMEEAKRRIATAEAGQQQIRPLLPIVSQADEGKNTIPRSNIRPSFQFGGLADIGKNIAKNVAPISSDLTSRANAPGAPLPISGPATGTGTPHLSGFARQTGDDVSSPDTGDEGVVSTYTSGDLERENASIRPRPAPAPVPAPAPAPPAVAPLPISGQRDIEYGTDFLRSIAEGKNPVLANMINETLRKHGMNTAAGKSELQMRLNAQGITGPAADAAMESFDRNSRLGRTEAEIGLTKAGMEQAQTAAGQLLTAGQTERSFDVQQKTTALATALQTGNFDQYRDIYKSLYGVDVDTTAFQQAYTDKQFNDARSAISQDLAINPATTMDDPKMQDYLGRMWKNSGGQGPMPADWAAKQFEGVKNTLDPVWQYSHSLSDENILSNWFGGNNDPSDPDSLASFEYEGKKGIDAFRAYIPQIVYKGGVEMVTAADGSKTFKIDYDNPVLSRFFGAAVTSQNIGTTIPSDYTASPYNPDVVIKDNKAYKVTHNTDGTLSISSAPLAESAGTGGVVKFGDQEVVDPASSQKVYKDDKGLYHLGSATGEVVKVDYDTLANGMPTVTSTAMKVGDEMTFNGEVVPNSLGAQGKTTFVAAGTEGNIGRDQAGNYFILGNDGQYRTYDVDTLVADKAKLGDAQYKSILTEMSKGSDREAVFATYKSTVGTGTGDPDVVTAFLNAGSTNALNFATSLTARGDFTYAKKLPAGSPQLTQLVSTMPTSTQFNSNLKNTGWAGIYTSAVMTQGGIPYKITVTQSAKYSKHAHGGENFGVRSATFTDPWGRSITKYYKWDNGPVEISSDTVQGYHRQSDWK